MSKKAIAGGPDAQRRAAIVQSEALLSAVAWKKGTHHEVDNNRVVLLSVGVMALNLWPEQPQGVYLLPPEPPFIELLPIKEGTLEEAASTLLLTDAQREGEYELVLTDHTNLTRYPLLAPVTSNGDPALGRRRKLILPPNPLIRCRLGDVVQVVGAYNQCPVVRFTSR